MNKLLLIDLRTPFHVREFKRVIDNFNIVNSYHHLIIAPKNLSLDYLTGKIIRYSEKPTSYLSLIKLLKVVNKIYEYTYPYKEIFLCTSINFGPLHDLLINKIKITRGYLFEDGISSYLNLNVNNYILKRIMYSIFLFKKVNIAKYKFFAVDLEFYDTIFTDKIVHAEHVAKQKNIFEIKDKILNKGKKNNNLKTKIFFLSSSSIEYGMQKFSDYDDILNKLSRKIISKDLIVSFHHNEKYISDKIDIIKKYFRIKEILPPSMPIEFKIFNDKYFVELIAPYNSTALSASYQPLLKKLILYNDNGPNIRQRIELFKNISPSFNFRNILI